MKAADQSYGAATLEQQKTEPLQGVTPEVRKVALEALLGVPINERMTPGAGDYGAYTQTDLPIIISYLKQFDEKNGKDFNKLT